MNRPGVLLMAHGTPGSLDDLPEYLRLIRGGRPAAPELVAEIRHSYEAIGGRSPLTDITLAQARALGAMLGSEIPVAVGMRNWQPFIPDALAALAAEGVDHVIAIPLAPQYSTLSVQKYTDTARAALPAGMTLAAVDSFHAHPLLLQAFAERIREAAPRSDEELIFTAHSVPRRVIAAGDTYASEVAATARGVACAAGLARYRRAYQSAGRTPEPWIGLDVNELIRHRAARGTRAFLVVPIGFVCDHTEILFDLDIRAAATARAAGATLRRTASLNTSPTFVALLGDLVRNMLSPNS